VLVPSFIACVLLQISVASSLSAGVSPGLFMDASVDRVSEAARFGDALFANSLAHATVLTSAATGVSHMEKADAGMAHGADIDTNSLQEESDHDGFTELA